jgi:hypothetical protein
MREDVARLQLPRPDWRGIAIRTRVSRRRAAMVRCGSLVVSMLLMVCTFVVTSGLPGVATSEVGAVSPPPVPQPVVAQTRPVEPVVMATPAPGDDSVEADDAVTPGAGDTKAPALVPLPTPP